MNPLSSLHRRQTFPEEGPDWIDRARCLGYLGGVVVPEGGVTRFPPRGPEEPPPGDGVTRRQRNASPRPFPAVWPPPGGADRGRLGGVMGEPARGGNPPTPLDPIPPPRSKPSYSPGVANRGGFLPVRANIPAIPPTARNIPSQ